MLIIGHRGARGEAPENTLAGFAHARSVGVRDFELDVRLSADGVPVVIHDDNTRRTTNFTADVANLTAAELANLDARHGTPGWHEAIGVPTLESLLVSCQECTSWQLEVKSDLPERIRPLARAVRDLVNRLGLRDRVTFTSLDVPTLEIIATELPDFRRAYVAEFADPPALETAQAFASSLLVINWQLVTRSLVDAAHEAGLPVSVWTVNDLKVADQLLQAGVDSIITDFPTAMLAHISMRKRLAAR